MALQGRWASAEWHTGSSVETIKLPSEVKDGSSCRKNMNGYGDMVTRLI